MLCEFEYPGNVRTLRNLIYELTSYVQDDEPISIQLVQFALAKLNHRIGGPIPVVANNRPKEEYSMAGVRFRAATRGTCVRLRFTRACVIASEGDIILPTDLC